MVHERARFFRVAPSRFRRAKKKFASSTHPRPCHHGRARSGICQVPLLAHDIEVLSISSLKCSELNDQLFLRSTISDKYTSVQAFQRMVQARKLMIHVCMYVVLHTCRSPSRDRRGPC